jgi:hypothetical protein
MNIEDQRELEKLESPEAWDWENGESYPGQPKPATELIVAFDPADLHAIVAAARHAGLNSVQFVRQAALEAARATSPKA